MEINSPHPYANLRAYRCAETLSNEVFWITRTFPQSVHEGLTRDLRESTRTVSRHVMLAWKHRFSGAEFREHLDAAETACGALLRQLNVALEQRYLPPGTHEHLLQCQGLVHQHLHRLRDQRIALLA